MKYSIPISNVANQVAVHVATTWPELAGEPICDLWFTGSQIWHHLYPDLPRREPTLPSDWDVVAMTELASDRMVSRFGLAAMPACLTRDKKTEGKRRMVDPRHVPRLAPPSDGVRPVGYDDGFSYLLGRGELDLWISGQASIADELRSYPDGSHAHCRAAFSFTDGLVVLPNGIFR